MTEQDKQQLNLEISHIFESGANHERIFNMVEMFIDRRYKALTIPVVVERLENLQKWYPCAGCAYDTPSIDWEEDNDSDWIRLEDVQNLIIELKTNAL